MPEVRSEKNSVANPWLGFTCVLLVALVMLSDVHGQTKANANSLKNETYRQTADSLNGVYIPKHLEDCYQQLDSILSDSVKIEIKGMTESDFLNNTHFGIGMWVRNNWQLWGGSRLSKYLLDAGVFNHADTMSDFILSGYRLYLKEEPSSLEVFVKPRENRESWK